MLIFLTIHWIITFYRKGTIMTMAVPPRKKFPGAVVNPDFISPAGITYQILQRLHVPVLAKLENEAFRITGNPYDDPNCTAPPPEVKTNGTSKPDKPRDPSTFNAQDCPAGYHWNFTENVCEPDATIPSPTPSRQPSGTILVFDDVRNTNVAVRNARVVAKRFLKIERTYTNNQGQYFINKEFNKVTLSVKFKNEQAKVRSLRRARLWQMLFPVELDMGKHKGSLNNITYVVGDNNDARTTGARNWAAAISHNNVQEYYDFAFQQGIGTPPGGLRILLTNWRVQGPRGAAPMYYQRIFCGILLLLLLILLLHLHPGFMF